MKHEKIQIVPPNSLKTKWSRAIRYGDLIFTTAHSAARPDGTMPTTPEEQIRGCFESLKNTLEAGGFHTVAGGAFSCQHAFSLTQAAGRPDRSDLTIASGFADQIFHKVEALTSLESLPRSP